MNKWWEDEVPEIFETGKNVLRYYPQAQKLQVSRPDWTDDSGNSKPGKTVVLDLAEPGILGFIRRITGE